MRWDATVELVHYERKQGLDGSFLESERIAKTVYCNRNTVGHNTLVGWTNTQLKPIAAVVVHTNDYEDEECAVLDGKEYTVERVSRKGDFITLTLGKMGRNV